MDKRQLQEKILEAKYERSAWIAVLREWFGAKQLNQDPQPISRDTKDWENYVESAYELGRLFTDDGMREVGIFEVELTANPKIEINRVKLRSLLSNIYGTVDGALIVFTQGDKWRFSYVSEILDRDANDNVVSIKTEPKRFTYFFGDGENCRTAADRFDKLKGKPLALADLNEAFSVEKLSKEFFKSYKEHFEKYWKYLAENKSYYKLLSDQEKEDEDKKTKPIRDFVKVLLGRLVFLQFLQKKGWMGGTNWTNGDVKFVQNLFNGFSDNEHFHSTALRTLFFETLNRKRTNDFAPAILGENVKIPYLNGGLFDGDVSAKHAIDFPAEFFGDLLNFFEQYNFTIDESDQFDREVGIDPEMLGHIFENLLEENREKGAFYTPKEIVHYMCQESLIEYLSTNLSDDDKADIELLVRRNVVSETIQNDFKRANEINDLLKRVKICDPAIGSGAFPMGLLKEIFECRRLLFAPARLENFNAASIKKEIIQNNIYGVDIEPGAVDIARLRFWLSLVVDETEPQPLPNLDYKIMQGNSLLERFDDIDLSRLVSADADGSDASDFMITEQHQLGFSEGLARVEQQQLTLTVFDAATKEQLQNLIEKYFDVEQWERTKGETLDKAQLKKQINDMVEGKIHAHVFAERKRLEREVKKAERKWIDAGYTDFSRLNQKTREFKNYELLKKRLARLSQTETRLIELQDTTNKPYFLWHLWFKDVFDEKGFDIFIGNPPYIQLQKLGAETDEYEKAGFQTFARTGDIYCLFYELGNKLLKRGGTLCYITSNKWMRADYGEKLRSYFLTEANPLKLVDFGGNLVFETATVDTNIFISEKNNYQNQIQTCFVRRDFGYKNGESLADYFNQNNSVITNFDENSWVVLDKETLAIKQFVEAQGQPLKDWDLQINRGILTGFDEGFVIDGKKRNELENTDKKNKEIIKPLLRGKDISAWQPDFEDWWLINTHNGVKEFRLERININSFPHIKDYLEDIENRRANGELGEKAKKAKGLYKRDDQGDTPFNLRNCAYILEFEKPKILYPNMTKFLPFIYDETGYFPNAKCYSMTGESLKYLTAFFNSRLFKFCFIDNFPTLGEDRRELQKRCFENIPVKRISKDEQKPFDIFVDYLTFLHDKTKPPVNPYADNKSIAAVFEDVLNMMVYELYFEEHLKENQIDVLKFLDTSNVFRDISDLRDEILQKEIIGAAYSWLQQSGNPIRDRITLANIRSRDIIRKINSSTH